MNRTNHNHEERLEEVKNLIYKLAWEANRRYGLPFDECLSECYWDFVRATNWRFKENRGMKFSSFLHYLTNRHFQTLLRKRVKQDVRFPVVPINEEVAGAAPAQHSPAIEALEGLSEDAQELVDLLLDTPGELLDVWEPLTPKELLKRAKKHLRKQGMSHRRIEQAHEEAQMTFRAIWAGRAA